MVMPVNQMCPNCGQWFMGSDAIGSDCPTCVASAITDSTVCDDCYEDTCKGCNFQE